MKQISREVLSEKIPFSTLKSIPDKAIDQINELIHDPDNGEMFRENIIAYGHILKEGRYTTPSFINAIKYVSFKMQGMTDKDAYALVFPEKIIKWDADGKTEKARASNICAFTQTQLVTKIMEQAITPVWLGNLDTFYDALDVQKVLMHTSKSDMVKHLAAKTILDTLKRPETNKIELDVGLQENKTLTSIRDSIEEIVSLNKQALLEGKETVTSLGAKVIAVDGEIIDE